MDREEKRAIADDLVAALASAAGDQAKEEAALRSAIEHWVKTAGGGHPAELGLVEYLLHEGPVEDPPALERVPGASEDDTIRWGDMLMDLADI